MARGSSTDSDFQQFLTKLRGLKINQKKLYETSIAELEKAWNENNKGLIAHHARSVQSKIRGTSKKMLDGRNGTNLTGLIDGTWTPKFTTERGVVIDQPVDGLHGNKAEMSSRGQESSKSQQSKLPVKTSMISVDEKAYRKCQKEVDDFKSENERLKEQLSDLQEKTGITAIKDKAKNLHNEKLNEWYTHALNHLQEDVEKSNFDSDFSIKGDRKETNAAKEKIMTIRECVKRKIKDKESEIMRETTNKLSFLHQNIHGSNPAVQNKKNGNKGRNQNTPKEPDLDDIINCLEQELSQSKQLAKSNSDLQNVMTNMKNRLYALSRSKQPSNSAGKKGKGGTKNAERTTPDNKEVEEIIVDLENVMSKHKQNIEDIEVEVKQLLEEVQKESYNSKESKRTGPVFDSIKELRNKLRQKQDENKKGNKDDVQKELNKLSDEVQNDKYDEKDSKGTGVDHDSIKKIRQILIQRQEENKNWQSSKEKIDNQIDQMEKMFSNFFFDICGERIEREVKTAFETAKVQTPPKLIQLMLSEIKKVIDRLKTGDQEASSLASSLVKSASLLYAAIFGTEQDGVTTQTLMVQLKRVYELHEKCKPEISTIVKIIDDMHQLVCTQNETCVHNTTQERCRETLGAIQKMTEKQEDVTELVRMSKEDLPVIYKKLMSIGFEKGAHLQERSGTIKKIMEYLIIIKSCVTTTQERCIVVEQDSVISALENMFNIVTGKQYKQTKDTHKVNERQRNTNDKNKRNDASTSKTPADLGNDFTVVISDMTLAIIDRLKRLESHAEQQTQPYEQMELTLQRMNAKLNETQQTLQSTEDARLELLNRLSKIAGAKMVEGNPNIADLSDTNRPTKLSEKYSELYDNEWTDAFDIVSKLKKDDESVIKILLDILLEAYRFCENVSDTQTFVLRNALLCPTQKVDESHGKKGKKEYKLESIQAKMVADLRKQTAGESTIDLKTHFKKEKVAVAGVRDCHVYADKCIELCWLMCLQSPPVFIGTKFDQKGKFDTNVYKPYSKSGKKYEFQVWPPLYLHEGGPLLSKGVAQGKK